jgi:hypothetical protein
VLEQPAWLTGFGAHTCQQHASAKREQHAHMRHAALLLSSLLPAGARLVLDAVCVLMGAKPTRVQQDPSHPSGKFVDSYAAPIKKMLALPWSDILSSIL